MQTVAVYVTQHPRNRGYAAGAVPVGEQPKPKGLPSGYLCYACSEKGTFWHYITKSHAEKHGFPNVKAMEAAGMAKKRF